MQNLLNTRFLFDSPNKLFFQPCIYFFVLSLLICLVLLFVSFFVIAHSNFVMKVVKGIEMIFSVHRRLLGVDHLY